MECFNCKKKLKIVPCKDGYVWELKHRSRTCPQKFLIQQNTKKKIMVVFSMITGNGNEK